MLNQASQAQPHSAFNRGDHSMPWKKSIPSRIGHFFIAVHYAITLLGITALFVLGLIFFNPDLAKKISALSPFSDAKVEQTVTPVPLLSNLMDTPAPALITATPVIATVMSKAPMNNEYRKILGALHQQKLVTDWLSKRYRVAGDATDMLVSAVYQTARNIKLDPLLILAVMAIESRFNPFAESPMGAQGLMQVMSKVHYDKFQELGGVKAALNPLANIKVGALILKEYVTRGGSVEAGLKSYVGATDMDNDGGYGLKVLSEYQNLKEVAIGKNVSIFTTTQIKLPTMAQVIPFVAVRPTAIDNITAVTANVPKKQMPAEEIAAL